MSLTSQLKHSASIVSTWFRENLNHAVAGQFIREFNDKLSSYPSLIVPRHQHYSLVGTAFDYCFRWQFSPLPEQIVAMHGARLFGHAIVKWRIAEFVALQVLYEGNAHCYESKRLATCAVVLSWFESVFRGGRYGPELISVVAMRDVSSTAKHLLNQVPVAVIDDLASLIESIPLVWSGQLDRPFILNPTFDGSLDIGGADADWITDHILFECKCSVRTRPFAGTLLRQALGYVLLDYDDKYQLHGLGWYYPRQHFKIDYSLDDLVPKLFTANLSQLRQSLRKSIELNLL